MIMLPSNRRHSHTPTFIERCILFGLLTATIGIHCQEVAVPERYLRPRTFNPHPYTSDTGLRDYSLEFVPEAPQHPSLDRHPYALFQRVDTRNDPNSPVRFPIVPQELKKSIKNKVSSKYFNEPKNYAFSYAVKDHQSGDDFSHSQAHNGKATQGEYRVKLPDGRVQVVSYTADNEGYKAEVRYDGEPSRQQEEPTYRSDPSPARLSPHPYPVPGYISALYNKKVQRIGPTAQTLLVYTPDSGYRAASVQVPIKYKNPPLALQKISPTISTDGDLGYRQHPAYYAGAAYADPQTVTQAPDVKPLYSDEALQTITAKYLQEVTSGREYHPTEQTPTLRDYALLRKLPSNPGPLYPTVLPTTPPKVVEENDSGSVNYSSEIHPTAYPAVYGSSTPSSLIYSDGYFVAPPAQTQQKLVKYVYVTPSDYENASSNQR